MPTPLMKWRRRRGQSLQDAAEQGNLALCQQLVETHRITVHYQNQYSANTALHVASGNGHLDVVRYLTARGADVNATNCFGNTPVMNACRHGHLRVVQYLITQGAQWDDHHRDVADNTLLHTASFHGYLEIVQFLWWLGGNTKQESSQVTAQNRDGQTPLHEASGKGRLPVVQFWITTARADVHARSKGGNTALHHAASGQGEWAVVRYLIEQGGADVHATNNDGRTALHLAAEQGHYNTVFYLVGQWSQGSC